MHTQTCELSYTKCHSSNQKWTAQLPAADKTPAWTNVVHCRLAHVEVPLFWGHLIVAVAKLNGPLDGVHPLLLPASPHHPARFPYKVKSSAQNYERVHFSFRRHLIIILSFQRTYEEFCVFKFSACRRGDDNSERKIHCPVRVCAQRNTYAGRLSSQHVCKDHKNMQMSC